LLHFYLVVPTKQQTNQQDCNWGDHCGMVSAACREPDTNLGPATVRTPNGLGVSEWEEGLRVYAKQMELLAGKK
jgi:hypothetical protein